MAEGTTPPALKHSNIRRYLKNLAPSDVRTVGLELGLHYSHLKRMNDDLDEMIPCWLREDDDVHDTSGTPSWESLAKALKEAGFNGVAANIKKACAGPAPTLEASVAGRGTRVSTGRLQDRDLAPLCEKLCQHAYKWKEIGLSLGFTNHELSSIEATPLLLTGAPLSFLREMLSRWLQWAPRDARGSTDYATLQALKSAVSKAGLGTLAEDL